MKRRIVLAFSLLILATPLPAQRLDLAHDRFNVDGAHSYVGFSIGFMGLTKVEGRFTRYGGTILYDEKDLTKSSVAVSIRTNSIQTGSDFRDNHLKTPDFFDAEKYPTIQFESTRIEKRGSDYALIGNLILHGVTKEVAIPFHMIHGRRGDMWQNTRIGFEGKLTLDRREFGITGPARWEGVLEDGRLTIGNDVEITLNIQGNISNFDRITLPPKHIASAMWKTLQESDVSAAIRQYREAKQSSAGDFEWGEGGLNTLGYKLLYSGRKQDAVEVFQLNAEAFPESANAYDSLADAYAFSGDTRKAAELYKKANQMDPVGPNARLMLRYLGAREPVN